MAVKRLPFVKSVWKNFLSESGLEPTLLSSMTVVGAKKGEVALHMPIEQRHLNRLRILHGGTVAAIVDLGGSLAVANEGLFATGVSIDMNMTFISSGGKLGDNIDIIAKCHKLGSNLAFTSMEFYRGDRMFAKGTHTKYIAQALNDPRNSKLED
ncbi:hypothetical protein CANCADRAFT_30048 [Tortispora caseinolytica NRRL Y-17796]|uniref:Thioesterase domain-containing protein n=1 Tax=Tortispora caseinolytica NRRL Y-17796 TaxID=767744 RepID=A0A1E4TIZ4_9ASCO|nr:hypothetical protein CANCADRAFT_30048 [Tortispora caseinolytica NRRL Y-17796]